MSDGVLNYGTISAVTDSTGQRTVCSSVDVLTVPKGHKPECDTAVLARTPFGETVRNVPRANEMLQHFDFPQLRRSSPTLPESEMRSAIPIEPYTPHLWRALSYPGAADL